MFCLPPGRPYRTVFAFPPQVPGPRTHWLSHVLLCSPAWRSIVSLLDIFEIDNNTFATVLELVQVNAWLHCRLIPSVVQCRCGATAEAKPPRLGQAAGCACPQATFPCTLTLPSASHFPLFAAQGGDLDAYIKLHEVNGASLCTCSVAAQCCCLIIPAVGRRAGSPECRYISWRALLVMCIK